MDEWLRLLDDASAADRAAARRRERALRTIDRETATLGGTFVDLAEVGAAVRVGTTGGRSYAGAVGLAAGDFAVVGPTWIAYAGMATVRPVGAAVAAAGDRAPVDLLLTEALARLVPERPSLALEVAGGAVARGVLESVGADVVTLRSDGEAGLLYVPSAALVAAFPAR